MIENIKSVNNPLTIFAIFAALAEIAGTVALGLVDKELQSVFIWFVMLFPVLLLTLFFLTLNFNPKVLYAPSDFKNEDNFLSTITGVNQVSDSLNKTQKQLEEAEKLIKVAQGESSNTSENEKKLLQISETVESAKESAEQAVNLVNQLSLRLDIEATKKTHLINHIRLNINIISSEIPEGINVENHIMSNVKQVFKINPTVFFKNKELYAIGISMNEWVLLEVAMNYVSTFKSQTGLAVVESYFSGMREVRVPSR